MQKSYVLWTGHLCAEGMRTMAVRVLGVPTLSPLGAERRTLPLIFGGLEALYFAELYRRAR